MYLYLVMNVNRRVRQGEWPDGQEKVLWGVPPTGYLSLIHICGLPVCARRDAGARRARACAAADGAADAAGRTHRPVSYTHLDVYKRQVSARFRMRWRL